ncbi:MULTISPECIES: ATP-binding cassette domain-containing protein [unclassified Streptosporangium]|uniref:ATP-binding cassette domain-containing protein n=1 Tax=unclassified Streptosporangium TaxID=2632669 RepID=UPI002DDB0E56|nr:MULTISPECIES: ATP-binding cassette domain-containing protein [unclassified Streptosporangium]
MAVILEAVALAKRFGSATAVRKVSLTVKAGQIVGLLGPNGAGKSTTLHMLLGLITPGTGSRRAGGELRLPG